MDLENFITRPPIEEGSYVMDCQFSPQNSERLGIWHSSNSVELLDSKRFDLIGKKTFDFPLFGFCMGLEGVWAGNAEKRKIYGFDTRDFSFDELLMAIGTESTIDVKSQTSKLSSNEDDAPEGDSTLIFVDLRMNNAKQILGSYTESHSDSINEVKFKPGSRDWLSTGGSDGLLNVFDLRENTEDDALQHTFNMESSIKKIRWSSSNSDPLLCSITDDNIFGIYNCTEGDELCKFINSKEDRFIID